MSITFSMNTAVGSQTMYGFGKLRDHLLPELSFRRRYPGITESIRMNAHKRQKLLKDLQAPPGIKIPLVIMAIFGVAAGYQHAVSAVNKGFDNKQRIHSPGTWNTDDTQLCGLVKPAHTGGVCTAIGAPVA